MNIFAFTSFSDKYFFERFSVEGVENSKIPPTKSGSFTTTTLGARGTTNLCCAPPKTTAFSTSPLSNERRFFLGNVRFAYKRTARQPESAGGRRRSTSSVQKTGRRSASRVSEEQVKGVHQVSSKQVEVYTYVHLFSRRNRWRGTSSV